MDIRNLELVSIRPFDNHGRDMATAMWEVQSPEAEARRQQRRALRLKESSCLLSWTSVSPAS